MIFSENLDTFKINSVDNDVKAGARYVIHRINMYGEIGSLGDILSAVEKVSIGVHLKLFLILSFFLKHKNSLYEVFGPNLDFERILYIHFQDIL